jgi:hypothetical protein
LKGETDFAEIALQPYGAARVESADLIAPKVIRPEAINAQALAGTSVIMLANVSRLDDTQLKLIEEFVRNGGGLLIAPGNRIDARWYEEKLFKGGKGLLPLQFGSVSGDPTGAAAGVPIVAQHFDHPALELFNDPRNGSLSEGAVKMWLKMKEESSTTGEGAPAVLARLESNDAFLAEKQFGEGRVLQLATALDADWSNLPMRPTYLPLLQRLTTYLASTVFPPRNLAVGRSLAAFLPVADAGGRATLLPPDGVSVDLPITKKGSRAVVEYARTQSPGLYTLTPPGGKQIHFVVNASRKESDLQKLSPKEIEDFARAHKVQVVRSDADYQQAEHTRRYGHELWKPILWVLLAFCFFELLLQQHMARARKLA